MFDALAPFYIIFTTIVILTLFISFFRNYLITTLISFFALFFAFITLFNKCNCLPYWAQEMLVIDFASTILIGITLLIAMVIHIISYFYFKSHSDKKEEYYILLQTAILGTITMITARNFSVFFLGLELLSIPLYALIAYQRNKITSVEAGVKYVILAGISTSVLVFGMALIYGASGTLDIYSLALYLNQLKQAPVFLLAGLGFFIAAIGFKLALAPFHVWSPDIYHGSSLPVTAFIASVAKIGVLAFLLRILIETSLSQTSPIFILLNTLAIISMWIGNLLALQQKNVKRIIAFSSISHMGYIFIALLAGGNLGFQATLFYIIIYSLSVLIVLGIVSAISLNDIEPSKIENYKGLYFQSPFTAILLTVGILSLAGMPLTAGFISKIYLAMAGVQAKLWIPTISLIINTGIGLFYYLRWVNIVFQKSSSEYPIKTRLPIVLIVLFTLLTLLIIGLGILPNQLMYLLVP